MFRIINYIRKCFCKHDFVFQDKVAETVKEDFGNTVKKTFIRTSVHCKKCGHHFSYNKFGDF